MRVPELVLTMREIPMHVFRVCADDLKVCRWTNKYRMTLFALIAMRLVVDAFLPVRVVGTVRRFG